jgi:glycosyltransferase involved in cell wall biosynthesis
MLPISVVVPTFDRWRLLPRALDSVRAQTSAPAEVIVIDDGSTDGTAERLRECYPEVRLLPQDNRGVSAARNAGIRAAGAPWIAFLDSDDAWDREKLAAQWAALTAPGESRRLVHTGEIWIRNGRRVNAGRRHRKRDGWVFEQSLELCAISPSAALVARSLLDEVGLFDESLPAAEDYDLWLRITCREPVLLVDRPLVVKHGGHGDQLSAAPALDRYRIRALARLLENAPLTPGQRRATLESLLARSEIYLQGVERRGRGDEARELRERRERWQAEARRLATA